MRARPRSSTAPSSCRCSATPLDDDIVQTAGPAGGRGGRRRARAGAVIEALWVFEVPMSLPIDARAARRAARARARGAGAGQGGGGGVRGRRGGDGDGARPRAPAQAIVDEARRRGVEAIVLAAEEPTRDARRRAAGRPGRPEGQLRGGHDEVRRGQGAVPRHPHRAAGQRRPVGRPPTPRPPSRAGDGDGGRDQRSAPPRHCASPRCACPFGGLSVIRVRTCSS